MERKGNVKKSDSIIPMCRIIEFIRYIEIYSGALKGNNI